MSRGVDRKVIIGEKFGRLTVTGEAGLNKRRRRLVFNVCDCNLNRIRVSLFEDLHGGKIKSCGCLSRENVSRATRKYEIIPGNKYNLLTIIREVEKPQSSMDRLVECLCDCGELPIYPFLSVLKGKNKSCGCYKRSIAPKMHDFKELMPKGEPGFNHIYAMYRSAAKKSDREFLLTKEEFRAIIIQNCSYCGDPPSKFTANGNPKCKDSTNENALFGPHLGIDRVDNSKGYSIRKFSPLLQNL